MIHAQQKGFSPPEVLRGLCNAVATNYKSAVVRGRVPEPSIALLGGVSANSAVVRALRETFELDDGVMFVPDAAESVAAVGAALIAAEKAEQAQAGAAGPLARFNEAPQGDGWAFPTSAPLTLDRVTLLRDRVRPYRFADDTSIVDAYLGLDVGSVGTKLVLAPSRWSPGAWSSCRKRWAGGSAFSGWAARAAGGS